MKGHLTVVGLTAAGVLVGLVAFELLKPKVQAFALKA